MSQIGNPVRIVRVPKPIVAPVFAPPVKQPEPAPVLEPVKVGARCT